MYTETKEQTIERQRTIVSIMMTELKKKRLSQKRRKEYTANLKSALETIDRLTETPKVKKTKKRKKKLKVKSAEQIRIELEIERLRQYPIGSDEWIEGGKIAAKLSTDIIFGDAVYCKFRGPCDCHK